MDLIIPDRLRERHWAGWDTAMKNGATRYGEGQLLAVPAVHKDGRQISIEFSIQLLKGGDHAIEWVVDDVLELHDENLDSGRRVWLNVSVAAIMALGVRLRRTLWVPPTPHCLPRMRLAREHRRPEGESLRRHADADTY